MSLPLTFDQQNAIKVLKVFGYTVGSSIVTLLVNLVPLIHSNNAIVLLLETIFINNSAVSLQQWIGAQEIKTESTITPPTTQINS